jgi:thermolysin
MAAVGCSSAAPVDFSQETPEAVEIARQISIREIEDDLAGEPGIDASRDLQVVRVRIDELSMAHTRLQQTFRGVPVWGAEAVVHLGSDGVRRSITSSLQPAIDAELDTIPKVSAAQAVKIAKFGLCEDCWTAEPEVNLWVIHHGERDRLAYRVELERIDGTNETSMPVVMIDAHTGEELFRYDNLQTASAATLYSGTVTINTTAYNSTYYLEDTTRKVGTFSYNNGTSSVYRVTDTDNVWAASAATDAHYGAQSVYDYYLNVHSRNGINGSGGPGQYGSVANSATKLISSVVKYSTNYNNAFWNGAQMTYGDGDGSTFSPLVTMDIAGHEMTHGVTENEAGLVYSNESGALNESMSDVFGAMVERAVSGESANTWKIGEQCYTPANGTGDALRYMNNPHSASNSGYTSDDDPDHYNERYTGTADNGGVHINSGIANYAFYLTAKGGTHHYSSIAVTGIGADNAAKIWYRALTTYMTSSTNFAGARTATMNAATDLFGANSAQYIAVGTAWAACGIGTVPGGGDPPPPPPPGSDVLTNGAFEGSVSPWVMSGNGYYVTPGNYPHGGTGYAYIGTVNSGTGTVYQQVTIPSTATSASLSFWLNVSSNETTTTTQYDKLYVEVRNSSGSLLTTLATYSNLNKGTAGVYSQKGTFNLLAYKGQTVRIQFRGTTDSTLPTTFRFDDVTLQ